MPPLKGLGLWLTLPRLNHPNLRKSSACWGGTPWATLFHPYRGWIDQTFAAFNCRK